MKAKILIAVACLCVAPTLAQAGSAVRTIKVAVECSCDDSVGMQLCLALKEKIRSSKSFDLVEDQIAMASVQGVKVHIVSLDIEGKDNQFSNVHSAAAVVVTLPGKHAETYLTSYIVTVGRKSVDDEASILLANLDQETDFLRELSN
jgi:hypothetical protein